MEYYLDVLVRVRASSEPGSLSSKHIATDFNLDISPNLKRDMYLDPKELPTAIGSKAITQVLVQGLIGNIQACHQKGFRQSPEHLRDVIAQLEHGHAQVMNIKDGYFGDNG